jgi:hypothetical protein
MTAMADDSIRDSMVKRFQSIPGLGRSKAELLFDAGYTTISSLQKADVDALTQINGISPGLARFISREVKTMSDDVNSDLVSCATDMSPTSKPDDGETASISVSEEPQGAMNIGKPVDDVTVTSDSTEGAATQPKTSEPSSGGIFSGLINSFKNIFGGSKAPEPSPEAKPAETSTESVTVKEDTSDAKPEVEIKTDMQEPVIKEGCETPKTDTDAKTPSEATIVVDHKGETKDEPKPEPKNEPEVKKEPPAEPKPAPKKSGENDKLVDDIIKELDLDKENR